MRAIIDRYRATRALVVRPVAGARHGHPLLVDRALFDRFRAADPAHGASVVVRQYASAEGEVDVADPGAFQDVDTPDEYKQLFTNVGREGS